MMDRIDSLRSALLGLTAYRPLLDGPVLGQALSLLTALAKGRGEEALGAYTALFYALRQEGKMGLYDYLADALTYLPNPYALALAQGRQDPALEQAAQRDVETLGLLAATDCDRFLTAMRELLPPEFATVLANLPRWQSGKIPSFPSLTQSYLTQGTGDFARYRAFLWADGVLIPVAHPDCPGQEELFGYAEQRRLVEENTRAFLRGDRVNDALLYGDSGTGKSATVKSLLVLPDMEKLRLIEIQKDGLRDMAGLIRALANQPQMFILFIDDLAFDEDDKTYSMVKTILEGGLERRPANVAIYATSNRRLLVRQTFSARAGDDVDRQETIQEKTALSDRFGLRILYSALTKKAFLDLAVALARQAGITLPEEELREKCVQWDMRFPGRTPRGARQFVASLNLSQ